MKKISLLLTNAVISLEEKKRHSPEHNLMLIEDKQITHWIKSIDHLIGVGYAKKLSDVPIYKGGGYAGRYWPFITPFN
jgi:hypothetical protein